jgi:murein DD-endopeptidase MepM/ murein hydrolase activator NlpD
MASADGQTSYIAPAFPPGTYELFVEAGTLLGYQGTWSGNPERPTGLHLHFSIATSLPEGGYANETQIENTYDPMPFLGLTADGDGTIKCLED